MFRRLAKPQVVTIHWGGPTCNTEEARGRAHVLKQLPVLRVASGNPCRRRMVNLEIGLRGIAWKFKRKRTVWVEVRASGLPGNKSVLRGKRSPGLNAVKVAAA